MNDERATSGAGVPAVGGRAAIVVAGGMGERFGNASGKQLAMVCGRPALSWSVEAMLEAAVFDLVVVVCHPDRVEEYRSSVTADIDTDVELRFVAGGDTRQRSVANGLEAVPAAFSTIAVHDGARPLVKPEFVRAVITAAELPSVVGAIAGHPSVDTLKIVEGDVVVETPERARFWVVQTPQAFEAEVLRDAYRRAASEDFAGTDDASLVERYGGTVTVVEGGRDNIKITLPEDVVFAEAVLKARGCG